MRSTYALNIVDIDFNQFCESKNKDLLGSFDQGVYETDNFKVSAEDVALVSENITASFNISGPELSSCCNNESNAMIMMERLGNFVFFKDIFFQSDDISDNSDSTIGSVILSIKLNVTDCSSVQNISTIHSVNESVRTILVINYNCSVYGIL